MLALVEGPDGEGETGIRTRQRPDNRPTIGRVGRFDASRLPEQSDAHA